MISPISFGKSWMTQTTSTWSSKMDSDKRIDIEHLIAQKLLEVVSQDDLENTYYDMQREWAETLPDDELTQTARDLGIEF